MEERFWEQLKSLVGDPRAHTYLLAVSGGADSCVMAHLFHQARLDFAIAHCNFHLRGEDSNQDMQLVKDLAHRWNVPVFIKEFDTPKLQKDSGLSVEMMARKLRYDWFSEVVGGYDYLATAHQADDAAETLLLNICRGTRLKGLASIPPKNGKIIRPLLDFGSLEIREYADQQHILYAIDRTNSDVTIKRNRIRAAVIPVLKEINPNLIQTIARNRKIIGQQFDFYQQNINEQINSLSTIKGDLISFNRIQLENNPHKNLLLFEFLTKYGFTYDTIEALCKENKESGTRYFSPSHTLLVNRDEFIIRPNENEERPALIIHSLDELKRYFSVERQSTASPVVFEKDNSILYLPENRLSFPILVTTWETGDYFYPLGGKGKQKISDFLIDHKIDRFSKQQIQLFKIKDDIVWIIGHRSDERYKVIPSKDKFYFKIKLNGTL